MRTDRPTVVESLIPVAVCVWLLEAFPASAVVASSAICAAAAEALGMPGPMGVLCARACSATMLVTADEWKARIWRAGEESPRRDYRALETKLRHRLGMSRWFDEWARRYRPGTRQSSYDLAVTWQWVHVAHAHLELSPAWHGTKPPAKDRARYRKFEHSLNEQQQSELATAPPPARLKAL